MHLKAFTLAELLIALAILGVIATFTIPKVLTAQADQQKKAVFKETIAALANITYTGNMQETFDANTFESYLLNHLNLVKVCQTDSLAQGCRTQAMPFGMEGYTGGILHSGATIVIHPNSVSPTNMMDVFIDWNGDRSPNLIGTDTLMISIPFADIEFMYSDSAVKLVRAWDDGADNIALYHGLFAE
ncbi:MAG: prepilin-type N-terminal cleavage/methylation domain-containing protein [Vampirovibrionales bacterium]|nr:prepilin-type N-terminal cleavage/methylation domain-containing protein [Vampirovibrionales bacterium]